MGPWCAQMGAGGWLAMGVFWLAVIGLAIWAVCRLFPTRAMAAPLAVLDARLAAGEIDPSTYRAIREELQADDVVTTKGRSR